MKKIHRYIFVRFVVVFFFAEIFSVLLFVLSDFFGNLSFILKNNVSFEHVLQYYFYFSPFVIYFMMPLIFSLAVLISLGFLSSRNEIIVMRSSGISIVRIALPVIIFSLLVSIIMFVGRETVVNYGLERASFIKTFYFKKGEPHIDWIKVGDYFINVKFLNANNNVGDYINVYKVKRERNGFNGIDKIFECRRMMVENAKLDFADCKVLTPPFDKRPRSVSSFFMKYKGSFYSLLSLSNLKEPSFWYIMKSLKNKEKESENYYISMLLFRVLYPISCFILTLLSLVFVLKITPRKGGFIKNVFTGGVVFLTYVGSFDMVNSMGKYSIVNPLWSMVVFILFWVFVSVYNLLKLGV